MMTSLRSLMVPMLLLALLPLPAQAVLVENLYQARVEVQGQGDSERARGFREGLEQVLVRMTGQRMITAQPEAEELLQSAHRYVESFRYSAIERDPDEAEERDEDAPTHYLDVQFVDSRLERALEERGIALWSRRRPEVLVWIAVDDGRDRTMVGEADGDDVRESVRELARERGLPVFFPILDTEDQQRVDFIDIRGRFYESLEYAGERYGASHILVGYIQRLADEAWEADWALIGSDAQVEEWFYSGDSQESVQRAGVYGATERIAADMLAAGDQQNTFLVRVQGVESLAGFAQVQAYLEDLDRMEGVRLVDVVGDAIRFQVQFDGEEADLSRMIARGDVLIRGVSTDADETVPMPTPLPGSEQDPLIREVLFQFAG